MFLIYCCGVAHVIFWHHSYATHTWDVGRRHRTCSSFIVVVWLMSYEKWHHSCATYSLDVGRRHRTCSSFVWSGPCHIGRDIIHMRCDSYTWETRGADSERVLRLVWMSHVSFEWVTSHVNESRMCSESRVDESWLTCEWVMSHVDESRWIYEWVQNVFCVACEWVTSHTKESRLIRMSPECVLSLV